MNSMDRPIAPAEQRRRRLRRLAIPLAVVGAAVIALVLTTGWLRPSIRRDRIRTALVERGEVTATLDASGLVVPELEVVLTAPTATRVAQVLLTPGTEVEPGDVIIRLDDRDARLAVTRLEEQISLKKNACRLTEVELARTQDDLKTQRQIKELELESLQYETERSEKLFDLGLVKLDAVRQAKTDRERAVIELAHLDALLANVEQDLAARLDGLALEIGILEQDLARAGERLERTDVKSERPGVVTWVLGREGATVTEGEPVARVADLRSYRVDATLSDVLARRLEAGLPATVRSGETRLTGRIHKVLPSVANGIVTFEVTLDDQDHEILRPNLRVDVHAVTDRRDAALRLRRGPLMHVDGNDVVFVVRGDRVVRTPIVVGLSNFEFYEISEGLVDGDEVAISDMSDYRNVKEVKLR